MLQSTCSDRALLPLQKVDKDEPVDLMSHEPVIGCVRSLNQRVSKMKDTFLQYKGGATRITSLL